MTTPVTPTPVMTTPLTILIADKFGPELPELLSKYGEVHVEDDSMVPSADVILVRSRTKVRGEYLDRAKNLKLVIRGGVGIDNIDVATCEKMGIQVRNTPDAASIAVAEMAFALMLGVVRHVPAADAGTKAGAWPKKQLKGTELYGKTLGLIGMGRIAAMLATRAKAFGMDVIAYDVVQTAPLATQIGFEYVTLDGLLQNADIISLHIPANEHTRNLIDAAAIDKMKTGAVLINTARGACVNTEDLVQALTSGKIAGAGLDVFPEEPVPADSPLLTAPNVVLAPHLGSSTAENMTRIGQDADRIIGELVAG